MEREKETSHKHEGLFGKQVIEGKYQEDFLCVCVLCVCFQCRCLDQVMFGFENNNSVFGKES